MVWRRSSRRGAEWVCAGLGRRGWIDQMMPEWTGPSASARSPGSRNAYCFTPPASFVVTGSYHPTTLPLTSPGRCNVQSAWGGLAIPFRHWPVLCGLSRKRSAGQVKDTATGFGKIMGFIQVRSPHSFDPFWFAMRHLVSCRRSWVEAKQNGFCSHPPTHQPGLDS